MDPRIHPAQLQVGDVITSDPRRDFHVAALEFDEFDVIVNPGDGDQVRIDREQTVTIRPRPA